MPWNTATSIYGCGKLQVICKLDPCDKKLPRPISNPMDTFQSYTYGSGQILNSCYIDTLLEAIYHPFTRQMTPATTNFIKTTHTMDTILESIVTREQGKFHSSKMLLWSLEFTQQHNQWPWNISSWPDGCHLKCI